MNTLNYNLKLNINNNNSNTYNTQSFTARPKPYNELSPFSRHLIRYMNKSAIKSHAKMELLIPELEGNVREVALKSSGGKNISAWDINPQKSENYVLFLHGMAQNVSNYQPLYKKLIGKNTGIFALEYRGYGANSDAKCSEYKLSKDVKNAYKYLTKEKGIKPENITVMGHSMGGALAVDFAKEHNDIRSLVLIAPITHMDQLGAKFVQNEQLGLGMSKKVYDVCQKFSPIRWLTGQNYNSIRNMRGVTTPVHIVQSTNDTVTGARGANRTAAQARKNGVLEDCIYISKRAGTRSTAKRLI